MRFRLARILFKSTLRDFGFLFSTIVACVILILSVIRLGAINYGALQWTLISIIAVLALLDSFFLTDTILRPNQVELLRSNTLALTSSCILWLILIWSIRSAVIVAMNLISSNLGSLDIIMVLKIYFISCVLWILLVSILLPFAQTRNRNLIIAFFMIITALPIFAEIGGYDDMNLIEASYKYLEETVNVQFSFQCSALFFASFIVFFIWINLLKSFSTRNLILSGRGKKIKA